MTILVFEKMLTLLVLMLLGCGFVRAGWIDTSFNRQASFLVVNPFLVGTTLAAVATPDGMSADELIFAILASFGLFAVGGILGFVAAKLLPFQGRDRQIAWLSVFFMNNVFIGFPLVESIFGQPGILCASLTNLPFNLLLYTVGIANLRRGDGRGRAKAREILSAPLISTLVAIILMIFHWNLPRMAVDIFSLLGSATVPVSLLVVGGSLSHVPIREALLDWRVYIISLVKLLLCPLVTWWILGLFLPAEHMIQGVLTIIAACPSAAMVAILSVRYGVDESLATKVNFLSTLLCTVTIPILVALLL